MREPGYASHITLRGATEASVAVYEDIVETAEHIKGGDVHERRLQPDGTWVECEERFPDRLHAFYETE